MIRVTKKRKVVRTVRKAMVFSEEGVSYGGGFVYSRSEYSSSKEFVVNVPGKRFEDLGADSIDRIIEAHVKEVKDNSAEPVLVSGVERKLLADNRYVMKY